VPQNTLEIVLRLRMEQAQRDQKQVDQLMRGIERSATRAGATVERGMNQASRGTRTFIRSAVDLQAVLQLTERVATQFGSSLRDAAAGTAVQQSFRNLARTSGVNADKLLENMQRASKGTVRELDLIRIANRAMLAGGAEFAEDLPRLFEIARAASIATGQDIGFVFDTLTRGIAKASPLLIDNAEIYIKIGQAVEQYADSLGKSVEALTMQERQMATRNAVLLQGSKLVAQVGSDTEAATDSFDKWNATIRDAQQDLLGFVNKLGPVGPLLYTTSQLLTGIAPLITAYVLLKNQAATASAAHAAALATETAATTAQTVALEGQTAVMGRHAAAQAIMARGGALRAASAAAGGGGLQIGAALASGAGLSSVLAGVAAGVAGYELVLRKLNPQLISTGDIFSRGGKILEYHARQLKFNKEAADEWMRAQVGIQTHAEKAVLYNQRVDALNESLIDYEVAQGKLTRSQFDFKYSTEDATEAVIIAGQALEDAYGNIPVIAQAMALFNSELAKNEDQLREIAEAAKAQADAKAREAEILSAAMEGLRDAGLETDALKDAEDKLKIALGQTTAEAVAHNNTITIMAELAALGVISYDRLAKAITEGGDAVMELAQAEAWLAAATSDSSERALELGRNRLEQARVTDKLVDAERDLASALQESIAELRDTAVGNRLAAAQQLADRLESLARNHAARMESIERTYRRRIQDIERTYSRTVAKAAEERDAEAIYDARIARADQLQDAERDRGDALSSESRSYADSIQSARDAYDQRVREINQRLQQEIQNERDAHAQELADLRKFYGDQLKELRTANREIEAEEWRHQQELVRAYNWGRRARSTYRDTSPPPPPYGTGMQHGGSGIVTGPASFFVEPGVREAYWFSGAMSAATQPAAGGFAMQPAVQGINVGGSVNVNASGLPERISEMVTERVAQTVIDGIASAFEAAL
jgi:hypothetical protein